MYKTKRKYPRTNLRELISIAWDACREAEDTYDQSKGKLTTWVGFKVHVRLQEHVRQESKYSNKDRRDRSAVISDSPVFEIEYFRNRLSRDAFFLVQLTLCPKGKLTEYMTDAQYRIQLKKYLLKRGWTVKRWRRCCEEIKTVLKEV